MVWLGLAGRGFLETMLRQGLFWQLSGGPCAPGGAFVGPINEERRMAMLELCPAGCGLCFWLGVASWSYGLAMVWLGRASLKPCSGKVCFGSFRVALVHLEALSSDQLMKREGWLCWSSVRPALGRVCFLVFCHLKRGAFSRGTFAPCLEQGFFRMGPGFVHGRLVATCCYLCLYLDKRSLRSVPACLNPLGCLNLTTL